MIDFIRFYALDKNRFDYTLTENETIKLMSSFDIATGEVKEFPKSGRFHNLEIKLTENYSYIKGSLHKMYNSYYDLGTQNFNDFSYCQTKESIELLCSELYVQPEFAKITNLEFGFNIRLNYNPGIFIENSLLMFDFENHTVNEKFNNKGNYKEFKKSDYSVKIYNKSKQYGCSENILRVEIKIIKKRVLERLNIYSLSDLLNEEAYFSLFQFLTERFDRLLIVDSQVMKNALETEQINMLKNYTNPHYWLNLKKTVNTNTYYKMRRQCNAYIANFQFNKSKIEVAKFIDNKYKILMDCFCNSYSKVA
jgi:hypothetical protein